MSIELRAFANVKAVVVSDHVVAIILEDGSKYYYRVNEERDRLEQDIRD